MASAGRFLGLSAVTLGVGLSSCSGGDGAAPEVAGEIGPEGGKVVAPADSPLAGFSLEIPAGALSKKVKVTLGGVVDPTPLPGVTELVGPQVRIRPEGTELAKPALLTVPLEPELFDAHAVPASTCKVWFRKVDGWERLEPVGTTDRTVTVSIPRFARAGAGIALTPKAPCTTCTLLPPLDFNTCVNDPASGYCVTRLPDPERYGLGDFRSLSIVGSDAYWVHSPGEDRITIAKYSLVNLAPASLPFREHFGTPGGSVIVRGRVVLDAQGNALVGVGGYGNIVFSTGSAPQISDAPTSTSAPRGFAMAKGGVLRRYVSVVRNTTEIELRESGGTVLYIAPRDEVFDSAANTDASGDTGETVLRSKQRGLGATGSGVTTGFRNLRFATGGFGSFSDTDGVTFGVGAFGSAGRNVIAKADNKTLMFFGSTFAQLTATDPFKTVAVPTAARDMAFTGDQTKLFVIHSGSPEVDIVDINSGSFSTLRLTSATDGTESRFYGYAIRSIPGTQDFLYVARGTNGLGELYRIKKM
jgi:hypothetical protein